MRGFWFPLTLTVRASARAYSEGTMLQGLQWGFQDQEPASLRKYPGFAGDFQDLEGCRVFTVEGLRNEVVGFKGVVFRFCGRFVFFKCIKASLIFLHMRQ